MTLIHDGKNKRQHLGSQSFILFIYLVLPQGQGHHNNHNKPVTVDLFSLWEETEVPGENPRLSAEL